MREPGLLLQLARLTGRQEEERRTNHNSDQQSNYQETHRLATTFCRQGAATQPL
jgi:hypothetical protein